MTYAPVFWLIQLFPSLPYQKYESEETVAIIHWAPFWNLYPAPRRCIYLGPVLSYVIVQTHWRIQHFVQNHSLFHTATEMVERTQTLERSTSYVSMSQVLSLTLLLLKTQLPSLWKWALFPILQDRLTWHSVHAFKSCLHFWCTDRRGPPNYVLRRTN